MRAAPQLDGRPEVVVGDGLTVAGTLEIAHEGLELEQADAFA
jgi:hypothetical protein